MNSGKILWQATTDLINSSNLKDFERWLCDRGLAPEFGSYEELWKWSVDEPELFWEAIARYYGVIFHSDYSAVLSGDMPRARWFEGATVNFAEHVFRMSDDDRPAMIFRSESGTRRDVSWDELAAKVADISAFLRNAGLVKGDRVVAFLPNIPEATMAMLATVANGCVWSGCSPDFGIESVIDRFEQIRPRILFAVNGYQYGGKTFDRRQVLAEIASRIPSIEKIVVVEYADGLDDTAEVNHTFINWDDLPRTSSSELRFEPVPFAHPLWILYSSGTTGKPKAITHSHGGILLEHLKYLGLHNDVRRDEKFFWFTTTGWMMWNYVQGALLHGATIVLYDGSPGFPSLRVLWNMAAELGIEHFGVSAPFLTACMKKGLEPGADAGLGALRTVSSTGAPLSAEVFEWVYSAVGGEVWLCSMSGGTDVCTAFIGGCITKAVVTGEIQGRALGCALKSYDSSGNELVNAVGEMVIEKPMPSMPVFFWNDPGNKRYHESYFTHFQGVWRHGDWITINDRGGIIIHGRSDATLNRQGVRIGTAEIYRALLSIDAISDALVVHLEAEDIMPLFVVLEEGYSVDAELKRAVKKTIRNTLSPRHVPDMIIEVPEIPYTISGKKLEMPVKKMLQGIPVSQAANRDSMKNPDSLDFFEEYAAKNGPSPRRRD